MNFCGTIESGTGKCRVPFAPSSMTGPASDPDASFTLEDLVGHEKAAMLTPSPAKSPALNGLNSPNGAAVNDSSYAARLDELLLDDDDDGSDSGGPALSSPNGHDHNGRDDDDEDDDDDDDEEGFGSLRARSKLPTLCLHLYRHHLLAILSWRLCERNMVIV